MGISIINTMNIAMAMLVFCNVLRSNEAVSLVQMIIPTDMIPQL